MKRRRDYRRPHPTRGFTLTEFAVVFVILAALGGLLLPRYAAHRAEQHRLSDEGRQITCASNEKQIGIALLLYAQDYDEHFPIAGYAHVTTPGWFPVGWATTPSVTHGLDKPGLLSPYVKSADIFHCPGGYLTELSYRYNDLATNLAIEDFADASRTVLVMDGESISLNVGHSHKPGALTTTGASVNLSGKVDAGKGTWVSYAAIRHRGGANYAFADGHVRWLAPRDVFFPPQASASRYAHDAKTKKPVGPQPGGAMTFGGKTYEATFHVR